MGRQDLEVTLGMPLSVSADDALVPYIQIALLFWDYQAALVETALEVRLLPREGISDSSEL